MTRPPSSPPLGSDADRDPGVPATVRLLLVEDAPDDADLIIRALRRGGIPCAPTRVETPEEMTTALDAGEFDLVISDYTLPRFSALAACALLAARGSALPVLIVSGTTGESAAVELMRAGASDFVLKGELARLAPAVTRELREAARRRARAETEAEVRRLEAARQREASLLHQIQEIALVGGWEWDVARDVLTWTEGAYRIFEASPTEFAPTLAALRAQMMPEAQATVDLLRPNARGGEGWDTELQITTLRGRTRWIRTIARPEVVDGVTVRVTGAMLDITDRKAFEEQLLLTDRLAAMGTIAAGIAHELNNPLTYLVAALPGAIKSATRAADADMVETLTDCLEGARRIAAIVRDLRVFSRTEATSTQDCRIDEVLETVVRMLNTEFQHRAVITREIPTELHVRGSSGRLAQLFTNLIINAVQAMPDRPAGGNLVRVTAAVVGDEVTIAVADNGSGIAPEVRDRLFMPFATTKPIGVGTGLGLSVCRQIVDALGGTIEVEDGDGDGGPGTTFQIRLPRARGNREPSQPLPAVSAPITARRVLIIDDEPLVRSVTARILRHHEIHTVASVTEALDLLARDPAFDAIICDLMMPGRTGMDFHAALAAIAPALLDRCVFATGGAVTTAARAFVDQLAPDRLLDKPYDLGALDAAIRAVAR